MPTSTANGDPRGTLRKSRFSAVRAVVDSQRTSSRPDTYCSAASFFIGLEPINPLRIDLAEDLMPRVWNTPVFILATVYFVVDGMFSHITQPITAWLARKKLFERV